MTDNGDSVPFPERTNYGCVDCGSINHTTGDATWCRVAQARIACPRETCYVPDTACILGFDLARCPSYNDRSTS